MFKEVFVNILQKENVTAYTLSKETGISQGLISDYKNGKKKPTIDNLVKIADCLNCSIDFLIGRLGTDEREIKLIQSFRAVNEDGKAQIMQQIEYISNDDKYKKFEDIRKQA